MVLDTEEARRKREDDEAPCAGPLKKAEAGKRREVIDRELALLYAEAGKLTPALILERATAPSHPLHRYFEWDDSKAAHRHRLRQATDMLMASRYVAVLNAAARSSTPAPLVTSIPGIRQYLPGARGEGFRFRAEILDDKATRQLFIERKREELRSWCRSVADVKELAKLRAVILLEIDE